MGAAPLMKCPPLKGRWMEVRSPGCREHLLDSDQREGCTGAWAGPELSHQLCMATRKELGLLHPGGGGRPSPDPCRNGHSSVSCPGAGAVYKDGLRAQAASCRQ